MILPASDVAEAETRCVRSAVDYGGDACAAVARLEGEGVGSQGRDDTAFFVSGVHAPCAAQPNLESSGVVAGGRPDLWRRAQGGLGDHPGEVRRAIVVSLKKWKAGANKTEACVLEVVPRMVVQFLMCILGAVALVCWHGGTVIFARHVEANHRCLAMQNRVSGALARYCRSLCGSGHGAGLADHHEEGVFRVLSWRRHP